MPKRNNLHHPRHPTNVLAAHAADTPDAAAAPRCLLDWTPADGFPRDACFASRTVFYPGAGSDGQDLALFNRAGAAACFVVATTG